MSTAAVAATNKSSRQGLIRPDRNKRRDAATSVRHILAGHIQSNKRPRGFGTPVALRSRELKPLIGLDAGLGGIRRQPFEAGAVELHADVMLGAGIAQVRRLLHPPH